MFVKLKNLVGSLKCVVQNYGRIVEGKCSVSNHMVIMINFSFGVQICCAFLILVLVCKFGKMHNYCRCKICSVFLVIHGRNISFDRLLSETSGPLEASVKFCI